MARFVSSPTYLFEHIIGSVVGTSLLILGTVALGAYLSSRRAVRPAMAGTVLAGHRRRAVHRARGTVHVRTPALGTAYLAGSQSAITIQFPAALGPITALALLLTVTRNLLLAAAIWRSGDRPRWSGAIWATGTVVFYVLGAALGMATTGASLPTQPVGAALLAIGGAGVAWAAYHLHAHTTTRSADRAANAH